MLGESQEALIKIAAEFVQTMKCEASDPLLVVFWNEDGLRGTNIVQAKERILDFFDRCEGVVRMEPFRDRFIFFKEPSLLNYYRRLMKNELPWAFCAGPETSRILRIPAGVPVAETSIIYKTERVEPDISESDFFML